MKSHQLINQTSGAFEYYSPSTIVVAAREVMTGIDLDPASSQKANEFIHARKYFTEHDDGLLHEWFGKVWLNHPFSRENNPKWINHLIANFLEAKISEFCCITYACTSEAWFRPLLEFPQCFLYPRTNYYLPDGTIKKGVTKGSVVTYGGPKIAKFRSVFRSFGKVKI